MIVKKNASEIIIEMIKTNLTLLDSLSGTENEFKNEFELPKIKTRVENYISDLARFLPYLPAPKMEYIDDDKTDKTDKTKD